MNKNFREIGIITENDLMEFVDSLNDEEEVKSDIYGYFSDRCAFSNSGTPSYVIMTKYQDWYCVWVTSEFDESYSSDLPYDLCDIFSSYKEADVYFKSLKHTGLKSKKEQIQECKNSLIDSGNIRIKARLAIYDTLDITVCYKNCLIIEHMKNFDAQYINDAIAKFNDIYNSRNITIYTIIKSRQPHSYQRFYFIEYQNANHELCSTQVHIPSILQGQKRCVLDLLKKW